MKHLQFDEILTLKRPFFPSVVHQHSKTEGANAKETGERRGKMIAIYECNPFAVTGSDLSRSA